MSATAYGHRTGEILLELADTLADDFDEAAFLHRLAAHSLELLDADGAGVLLAGRDGTLRVRASAGLGSAPPHDDSGLTAFHTGTPVTRTHLSSASPAGYRSVHAIPMRRGAEVIGALNLFRYGGSPLSGDGQVLGRALADMATVGLLQQRAMARHRTLSGQLQQQFTTRLAIEQAKGLLAERHGITPEEAFHRLRCHARDTNHKLAGLAQSLIDGTTTLPLQPPPPNT